MTIEEFDILHDKVYDRIEKLTGDKWAPYPSELFLKVVEVCDDKIATELISERRKYLFGTFLGGDPQNARLLEIAEQMNLTF